VIADRYELIEQIGTGGMATVWKARDTLLGRTVAIKRLLPHLADDPGAAERFKREAQAAAALNHRGIVTVFDTGDDDSGPYIVLELLAGETLAALLARSGPLDPRTVIDFVSQVGVALDHAHGQRVIHRDIKPGNLIVDGNGVVRLTDFGIARTVDDPTTVTATGELVGTISYLAPEILEGERATPASDVYSLAAVTYELLSGKPPFTAETPAALLEAVRSSEPPSLRGIASDEMASAVTKAMAKIPEDRPTSAGLFVTGLIGSATLVMDPGDHPGDPRVLTTSGAGSEEPTLITEALAPGTPGEAGSGDPIAAAAGDLAGRGGRLIGLLGVLRVLLHRRGNLFHRGRGFFKTRGLLFGALRQVRRTGRYLSRRIGDFARPRLMTPEEREVLLAKVFTASGW